MIMLMIMTMTMKMRVMTKMMMEPDLLPAKSLSLLLWRPHHPMLMPFLQACSAHTFHLEGFTFLDRFYQKFNQYCLVLMSWVSTCDRTGLGSAVPASRLAFSTRACNTSITWMVKILSERIMDDMELVMEKFQKLTWVSRIFSATSLLTETMCWTITAPRSTISSSVLANKLSRQSFHCFDSNT